MNTKHTTPILTRVLYAFGVATIIIAVLVGGFMLVSGSLGEGVAVIIGGVFAGIIYIGIGQAVDFLARTAFSTDRFARFLRLLSRSGCELSRAVHLRRFLPRFQVPKRSIIIPPTASSKDQWTRPIYG